MTTIAIPYDSGQRHTRRLAELIAEGAGPGALPLSVADLTASTWDTLNAARAIVFGTPTYMGGVTARFKAFMDETGNVWEAQPWRDKIAAGFTVGTNQSGDKLATLQHLAIFAAQHGMIWVGQSLIGPRPTPGAERGINADGSWLGLMATSSTDKSILIPPGDADTARAFGQRIAASVARWAPNPEEPAR